VSETKRERRPKPGDLIAIAAPASPFDRGELFRGLAWLRTRYRLRIDTRVLTRTGYLAGTDADRADCLARAMVDPEVAAIITARGGYGTMRIVDDLPWDDFARAPKPLVGFSDITALHVAANARGIPTIHGPNVTGLGRNITAAERFSLIATLEGLPLIPWELAPIRAGNASGPLVGGNLALVEAMAAAGRLRIPDGAIVVLEDVTERPYRIDRMLTSLLLGGYLAKASAVVFGAFTQCAPGPDGITTEEVLRDRTSKLGIPIYENAPFGHANPNMAFPLGAPATLRNGELLFS
jgi:muramoyltetrapeptide carboxypeptidase